MPSRRVIAKLEVKGANLIKGVQLEGLRVVGDPVQHAQQYYAQGIDELIVIDIVASLYRRNNLFQVIEELSQDIFVPLTVGGGVRSVDDVDKLLNSGADRIAINTAAIANPAVVVEIAKQFGSQILVGSVACKLMGDKIWEPFVNGGRESTGLDVVAWAKELEQLGVGEILLTSIDQDGLLGGFDLELINEVTQAVACPVIVAGGLGKADDAVKAAKAGADSLCVSSSLHFNKLAISDLKRALFDAGFNVRFSDVAAN